MTERVPFNLLFVCTGNTCRSPMAEVIVRRVLEQRGWDHVVVRSAGAGAYEGAEASGGAVRAVEAAGLSLEDHRSTALTPELVAWADRIVVMSPSHALAVAGMGGSDKVAALGAFAPGADPEDPPAVADPFGGSDEIYAETYRVIADLVERMLEVLQPEISP